MVKALKIKSTRGCIATNHSAIYLLKEIYVLHFEKLQGLDRSQNLVRTSPKYLNPLSTVTTSDGFLV